MSRLLAEPCEPEGITEARARGLKGFLRGLHPGKATSLSQERAAKREGVQVVIDKINVPQLGTKRVSRAQQLLPKLWARASNREPSSRLMTLPVVRPMLLPTPPLSPQ